MNVNNDIETNHNSAQQRHDEIPQVDTVPRPPTSPPLINSVLLRAPSDVL